MSAVAVGLSAVLAHQGGWDEIAFVAVPLLLFAGMLFVANRRATEQAAAAQRDGESASDHTDPDRGDIERGGEV